MVKPAEIGVSSGFPESNGLFVPLDGFRYIPRHGNADGMNFAHVECRRRVTRPGQLFYTFNGLEVADGSQIVQIFSGFDTSFGILQILCLIWSVNGITDVIAVRITGFNF